MTTSDVRSNGLCVCEVYYVYLHECASFSTLGLIQMVWMKCCAISHSPPYIFSVNLINVRNYILTRSKTILRKFNIIYFIFHMYSLIVH